MDGQDGLDFVDGDKLHKNEIHKHRIKLICFGYVRRHLLVHVIRIDDVAKIITQHLLNAPLFYFCNENLCSIHPSVNTCNSSIQCKFYKQPNYKSSNNNEKHSTVVLAPFLLSLIVDTATIRGSDNINNYSYKNNNNNNAIKNHHNKDDDDDKYIYYDDNLFNPAKLRFTFSMDKLALQDEPETVYNDFNSKLNKKNNKNTSKNSKHLFQCGLIGIPRYLIDYNYDENSSSNINNSGDKMRGKKLINLMKKIIKNEGLCLDSMQYSSSVDDESYTSVSRQLNINLLTHYLSFDQTRRVTDLTALTGHHESNKGSCYLNSSDMLWSGWLQNDGDGDDDEKDNCDNSNSQFWWKNGDTMDLCIDYRFVKKNIMKKKDDIYDHDLIDLISDLDETEMQAILENYNVIISNDDDNADCQLQKDDCNINYDLGIEATVCWKKNGHVIKRISDHDDDKDDNGKTRLNFEEYCYLIAFSSSVGLNKQNSSDIQVIMTFV